MQKIFYVMVFVVAMAMFSMILPYPVLSNQTNLTKQQVFEINNHFETELQNTSNQSPKILDLDWHYIDSILSLDSEFAIIDLTTEASFYVQRTGGTNHADIEVQNKDNSEILSNICQDFSWERRPVLVVLNDNAYLPASLCIYPHGFSENNIMNGHLCLHFKNSKTHGTNKIDEKHQKTIKNAEKIGKNYIKNIEK
ncbi:MAG: hypothetical protein K2K31_00285 [Clostridia bacterium]|nr:hypothetical protein [Clostridia bacterium]